MVHGTDRGSGMVLFFFFLCVGRGVDVQITVGVVNYFGCVRVFV